MFLSPLLLKEKLTIIKVLCIISAMIGMFCIVGIDKSNVGSNSIGDDLVTLFPTIPDFFTTLFSSAE